MLFPSMHALMRSLAQVALWLRTLRICTLSVTMGPLVLMMMRMLVDVFKTYVLLLMWFLFLSSGIATLYAGAGANATQALADDPDHSIVYVSHHSDEVDALGFENVLQL